MRLLLQNLQSGIGMTKGYHQYPLLSWKYLLPHNHSYIKELAEFVKKEKIDVVLLNEADDGSLRTIGSSQIKLISEISNLKHKYYFPVHVIPILKNQGNAVISRTKILEPKQYLLPGRGEPRFLCHFAIKEGQKQPKINIFLTHLSLGKNKRRAQFEFIESVLKKSNGHIIFAGDLNTSEDKELESIMSLRRISKHDTFPSWNPKSGIDHIFISKDIGRHDLKVCPVKISDHLGLVLEID